MNNRRTSIVPVVLSGGSGTRLWPESREHQPKQLLPLTGPRSMIQETVDRVAALGSVEAPIVVTSASHAIATRRAMNAAGYGDATLILEPVGRNTAPAVAAAALEIQRRGHDALMLVLPADHTIGDQTAFAAAIDEAARIAADGHLVTFGITPTAPETGYGYIRSGDPVSEAAFRIDEFKEKPDAQTAQAYVDSGEYSWNSGMFLFLAGRYLEELEVHRPDIAGGTLLAFGAAERSGSQVLLDSDSFGSCPAESIDFAVMEKTKAGAVVPIDPEWNDVGSWSSLWEITSHDADGNAMVGDVVVVDTSNSYIRASDRLIATAGVDNLVIVETPDAVLVTSKDSAQDVKRIVDLLRAEDRPETVSNGTVFAEWGTIELMASAPGHQVQLIDIDPDSSIPLHDHDDKMHIWQVVRGRAELSVGGSTKIVEEGDSLQIPPSAPHSVTNAGEENLMLIQITVDTVFDSERMYDFIGRRRS